ncbi:hypothetical protein, partial [Achromobacter pulmonis]|uniref:hypothetical protein n=1 Tax=Achromobacter pulmonis TaxID=1389932 RepID=UPI001C2EC64B
SALLRLAVQRLMSSSIFMLIVNSLDYDVSRFSLGHYNQFIGDDGKSEPWFGGFKKCLRSSNDRLLRFTPIHRQSSVGISKHQKPENGCCPYCSDIA